ncbi:MAG: DUF502 domain-containing protein [Bacillota bacterium]
MRLLRRWFLTGLVVLLPLIVTGYILWFGFNLLDGFWRSLLAYVLGYYVPGVGAILTVTLTMGVGALATNVFGRQLIAWGERLLQRIPVVRSVYTTTKQVVDVFAGGHKTGFQRVVLFEYPRRGIYSLGFLTATTAPEAVEEATGEEMWSIFVPTAPNPTTGWLAMVPKSQCRLVDMTTDEAFRLIISGGVLIGERPRKGAGGSRDHLKAQTSGSS